MKFNIKNIFSLLVLSMLSFPMLSCGSGGDSPVAEVVPHLQRLSPMQATISTDKLPMKTDRRLQEWW